MIFIIKGFNLYCYFHNISANMSFFRCLSNSGTFTELRTTSFTESMWSPVLIPLAITGTNVKYSCIVARLQSGLNLQPPEHCLLRKPMPITITLCVLLDNSEWIFGIYKLNVLTWLGLLLLCMIFLPVLIFLLSYMIYKNYFNFSEPFSPSTCYIFEISSEMFVFDIKYFSI